MFIVPVVDDVVLLDKDFRDKNSRPHLHHLESRIFWCVRSDLVLVQNSSANWQTRGAKNKK